MLVGHQPMQHVSRWAYHLDVPGVRWAGVRATADRRLPDSRRCGMPSCDEYLSYLHHFAPELDDEIREVAGGSSASRVLKSRRPVVTQHPSGDRYSPRRQIVARIGTYGAAAVMLVSAAATIFLGISTLAHDRRIVTNPDYSYVFSPTAWGWINIIEGILVGLVAFGLLWSTRWARVAATIIASVSIMSQFLFLPHYPVWAIVQIALDLFIIWAVTTWESPAARVAPERVVSAFGAQSGSRWPELSPWQDGFPSWPALQPMLGGQPIRLEDKMNDGRYEIRAELPGIDPAKDVDVSYRDGILTVSVGLPQAAPAEKHNSGASG